MLIYEYPLNEKIRTWLRFERIFKRINCALANRKNKLWEWIAIKNLIDLVEISDRSDLKTEILKELIRLQSLYEDLTNRDEVDHKKAQSMKERITNNQEKIRNMPSKPGMYLNSNPWFSIVSSRMSIPGGCNEFDVPSYKWWENQKMNDKYEDFVGFYKLFSDLSEAIEIILLNIRESSIDQKVIIENGAISIEAKPDNVLIQIKLDENLKAFPEVTAHRVLVNVRLLEISKETWEIKKIDFSPTITIRQCFALLDNTKQNI